MQDGHHIRMHDEYVEGGAQDHGPGVHVGLLLLHVVSRAVVLHQLAQEHWLRNPGVVIIRMLNFVLLFGSSRSY